MIGHSKPFKYKRYMFLLSLPTPKCGIIIKVRNTGKIIVQKVLNDVRIIASYVNIAFNQQGVYYLNFCCKYVIAIKQVFLVGKGFTSRSKKGVQKHKKTRNKEVSDLMRTQFKLYIFGCLQGYFLFNVFCLPKPCKIIS